MREAMDRRREPTTAEDALEGEKDAGLGQDGLAEVTSPRDAATGASPEAFFAELTERADVREFLKRLADR